MDVQSLSRNTLLKYAAIALAVIVGLSIIWPFNTVPTGSRGVVTRFGKIIDIENEGLVILPPWEKLALFSIRAEAAAVDNAEGSTADTQPVHISFTVRYSIQTNKVAEVFEKYSHNGDLSSYVQTSMAEAVKAVTARYTAPDLIAQRSKVSADVNSLMREKMNQFGAQIISIDMRNFAFQESYMRAINDKVTQEQLRLAADNKLKTVESEQKQKVAIAEAEASAVKARADGDAYANLTIAKAQAEALRVQNAALAQNKDVLELRRIEVEKIKAEKWDGRLPQAIYAGAPIPFLNVSEKPR